jgi:hypothetical protein
MNGEIFLKSRCMKHAANAVTIAAMLLVVLTSCSRSKSTSSEPVRSSSTLSKPLYPLDRVWTFKKQSVNAPNPITITLRVRGTTKDVPFLWSVQVTNTNGSLLFSAERDDQRIDQFFSDEGYMPKCEGYRECKDRWYFEELPKDVADGMKIIDHSNRPVETWEYDALVTLAGDFLRNKGLSAERSSAVIAEMSSMLAGRFDALYIPLDPAQEDSTFMYVPSVGYFVPYWHP